MAGKTTESWHFLNVETNPKTKRCDFGYFFLLYYYFSLLLLLLSP